jgi:hypothetical protein
MKLDLTTGDQIGMALAILLVAIAFTLIGYALGRRRHD